MGKNLTDFHFAGWVNGNINNLIDRDSCFKIMSFKHMIQKLLKPQTSIKTNL